jgi:GGDEF domain-containing protein
VLAPKADRSDADKLAERLARAVRFSVAHRGSSLEVAIGTAVCPEDGREAAVLAAHADVGLYAARSVARAATGSPAASVDRPA